MLQINRTKIAKPLSHPEWSIFLGIEPMVIRTISRLRAIFCYCAAGYFQTRNCVFFVCRRNSKRISPI